MAIAEINTIAPYHITHRQTHVLSETVTLHDRKTKDAFKQFVNNYLTPTHSVVDKDNQR